LNTIGTRMSTVWPFWPGTTRPVAPSVGPSRMVGVVGHFVNIVIVPTDKGVIQRWPAGG
jgi:hypothetical protein